MANDSISLRDLKARIQAVEEELRQAEETIRQAQEVARKTMERREQLRTALQVFEEMLAARDGHEVAASDIITETTPASAQVAQQAKKTLYAPSGAAELAIRELESRGDLMTTQELLEILVAQGFKLNPKMRPYDALYGLLWHGSRKKNGRLVKKDLKWGLREWNREEDHAEGKEEVAPLPPAPQPEQRTDAAADAESTFTKDRALVLLPDFINSQDGPFTRRDMIDFLAKHGLSATRQSMSDTVTTLKKKGIVVEHSAPAGGIAKYVYTKA